MNTHTVSRCSSTAILALALTACAGPRPAAELAAAQNAVHKAEVAGAMEYAPEQIKSETIDERCDIYALGCVIFECLTGQLLFAGESINDLIVEHLHNVPSLDPLPQTAGSLREVIAMCVEKDPDKRFRNVAALRNALSRGV